MTQTTCVARAAPRQSASRKILRAAVLGVLVVLVPSAVLRIGLTASGNAMLFNDSVSMPLGWYRKTAGRPPLVRGTLVCVQAADRRAPAFLRAVAADRPSWRVEPLLKEIVGVVGDRVTYEGHAVTINGVPLAASMARALDSAGQPLPQPLYPITLQRGEVWLASSHPDGLDSRYFGPVSAAILSCAAKPWLTF